MSEPLPLIQADGAGEFVLYTTEDGLTRIEMRAEGGTLWLSQAAIATLFQTTPQNVTQHVKAIFAEGEADEAATCKSGLQVRQEGGREVKRTVRLYSLEVILAVGYRVRSARGTQFRQWATAHLSNYLVKGFVLDDARFKSGGDSVYFDELLARIRDIRSSEKVFWRPAWGVAIGRRWPTVACWLWRGPTRPSPPWGLPAGKARDRGGRTWRSRRTTSARTNWTRSTASSTCTSSSPKARRCAVAR